jgi:hypothetical protein
VSVGKTGPVNIGVDDKVRRRGATKKQAVVEGALEVPKDALRGREMGLTRDVHVEAHLLDCIGNVGPGEGEVLESPSQAAVGSSVLESPSQRRRCCSCPPPLQRRSPAPSLQRRSPAALSPAPQFAAPPPPLQQSSALQS